MQFVRISIPRGAQMRFSEKVTMDERHLLMIANQIFGLNNVPQ